MKEENSSTSVQLCTAAKLLINNEHSFVIPPIINTFLAAVLVIIVGCNNSFV
jgi:hypothetical protein